MMALRCSGKHLKLLTQRIGRQLNLLEATSVVDQTVDPAVVHPRFEQGRGHGMARRLYRGEAETPCR